MIKEAIQISKNSNNFNRDDGLELNHIWTSALRQDGALSLVRSKQAARTNENAPRMDERQPAYIAGQAAPESDFSSEESHEKMAETSVKTIKTRRFPESQENA